MKPFYYLAKTYGTQTDRTEYRWLGITIEYFPNSNSYQWSI